MGFANVIDVDQLNIFSFHSFEWKNCIWNIIHLVRNVSFTTLVLTPFSLTQTTPNFKRLIWLPQSLETDLPHELNSKRKLLQKRSFHTFGVKILQSGNIQWDDTWVPRSSVRHLPQSSKPGKRKLFCFHILFPFT